LLARFEAETKSLQMSPLNMGNIPEKTIVKSRKIADAWVGGLSAILNS
jgi:hypothetical protein